MHGLNLLQLRHHDTSYMTPTIWNNISHHKPTHAALDKYKQQHGSNQQSEDITISNAIIISNITYITHSFHIMHERFKIISNNIQSSYNSFTNYL